jgi:LacI family transcriptional regulator
MKNKSGHVTIYDVAQKVGVSTSTVSRALGDHHSIGKKTIKKVKRVAIEMGYQPNVMASNLRRKRSNTIGVIVSYINRPFISSFISGIEATCSENNYNVVISQSFDDCKKEMQDVKTMFGSRVDGLIVSLAAESCQYEHFNPFLQSKYPPLVFADRVTFDLDTDRVLIDNFESAYTATKHLIDQGYQRIGHLAGVQQMYIYQKRLQGYMAALKDRGMPVDENLIYYSRLNFEDGVEGARQLLSLENKLDAVFASNDRSAIGFMQYAESSGYSIPDQIGVVGFNNDPISSMVKPKLTTIDHPAEEIGRKAAELILEKIIKKNSSRISQTISFKTNLVIRESSIRLKQ